MARIAGITLNDNERAVYAITNIYGIGWSRAEKIVEEGKIDKKKKLSQLNDKEIKTLQTLVEKYKVEGVLKEEISESKKRLMVISSYRGKRHSKGLPVRGQRTRSNARTKRGKRKTVGALKKEEHARIQQAAASSARK